MHRSSAVAFYRMVRYSESHKGSLWGELSKQMCVCVCVRRRGGVVYKPTVKSAAAKTVEHSRWR
jgi:hypothetical protein